MYNITLTLRRNARKRNGEFPINIWLKIDNHHAQLYSVGVSVLESNWNKRRLRVKNDDSLFFTKNNTIQDKFSKAEKILLRCELDGNLSYETFSEKYNEITKKNKKEKVVVTQVKTCYYKFAKEFIALNQSKWVPAHKKHYDSELTKLEAFQKYAQAKIAVQDNYNEFEYDILTPKYVKFSSGIFIEDMDVEFCQLYEKWMREERHNISNTVHKSFKFMKPILAEAVERKIIEKSPFKKFGVKRQKPKPKYLTMEELKKLTDFYQETTNEKLRNVLRYFLFGCYTGIRFSDVLALKYTNIIENSYVEILMDKGDDRLIVPLSKHAKALIPPNYGNKPDPVFRVLSNQKTNDYLKIIADGVGINKDLTFHVSRHTFATATLTLDVELPVVQKLLGHQDIRTTQIYAQIVDKKRDEAIGKWDKMAI